MAEEEDATAVCPETRDQVVSASACRCKRLAPRAAVAEEILTWPLKADIGGEAAFVIAVVRFHEFRGQLGDRCEARQFAGPPLPLEGADQDLGEREALESPRSFRALLSPRRVSERSVNPVCRPDRDHAVSP